MKLENNAISKAQRLAEFAKANQELEMLAKDILLKDEKYKELLEFVKTHKIDLK